MSEPIDCGRVTVADDVTRRKVAHAVALAFDLTLPSDVRLIIGGFDT